MSEDDCAERVRLGDPDRFLATLTVPRAHRGDLFTLYALNLEVARAPWVTSEAMIAEMRLQWWRDVVSETAPRAHEVAGPVHALIARRALPLELLDQMIAARIWDIYRDPFDDEAAFDRYIDHTAGHLMWLAALICGAKPQAEGPVRQFAYAAGLAAYLRAAAELESRGRLPFVDGRPEAIGALAQKGLKSLALARANRGLVKAGAPALRTGWQAGAILAQAAAEPHLVADGALGLSEFSRRSRLFWAAFTGRW